MAGDIKYGIETDVSGSINPLQQLQGQVTKTQDAFSKLKSAIGTLGVGALVASAFQLADSITDVADASGMALQNVMGFSKAIAASGGSVDGALNGIGRFNQTLNEAVEGSKNSQNAFLELGITFEELRTLSEQDLLRRTIEGLAGMNDNAKRTALSVAIFNKEFAKVNFVDVNKNIDDFIKKSGLSAEAVKAAGEASDNFASAFKTLQIQILSALEPISKLVNSISKASEAINFFIDVAVKIGTVIATFFVFTKVLSAASFAWKIFTGGASAAASATGVAGNALRQWKTIQETINKGVEAGGSKLAVYGALVKQFGVWLKDNIPGLAAFAVGVIQVSDYVGILYDKLKGVLGLGSPKVDTSETERENKLLEQRSAELKRQEENKRKIKTESEKLSVELNKILKAYQDTNKEANKKYQLETDAINQTDKAKALEQEKFAAFKAFKQEEQKLQDQINERRAAGTPVDLAVIPQLVTAQGRLRAEYDKQKASIDALVESRIAAERAKQLDIFSTTQLIDLQNKANDLIERSATMFLPLQAKGYAELEIAARNAAKAKIEAEQERRGEPLSAEEQVKYYEAARQGIDSVKAAQDQLNISTSTYNLEQFKLKTQLDNYDKIRDVQMDMVTGSMTEIEKKFYNIEVAATKAAEAQIRAEEQRTGRKLSEAEATAYYEAAAQGIKELQQAEADSYDLNRNGIIGLRKAMAEYADSASNAAKNVADMFAKQTQRMEDSIVKFAKTGKFEFKEFINGMLEDLLRSQLRQTMGSLFQAGLGSVRGGTGGLLGGSIIPGILAEGGPVSDRRPYLVGERGPELFIPNSAGSMVPNSGLSGGGNVTYNISAVDALSFKQMIAKDPGFIHAIATQGSKYTPARR